MKKLSKKSANLIEILESAVERYSEQLEVGGPPQWKETESDRNSARAALEEHIRKLEAQLAAVVLNLKDHKPENVVQMILRNATK